MKVQLADREVWIEFAYETVHVGGDPSRFVKEERDGQAREVTHCLLRDGSAPRGKHEDAPILAQASVVRFFKDPPNRDLARKAALTKALEDLDRALPIGPEAELGAVTRDYLHQRHLLAKARRTLFWAAYRNRKPGAAYGNICRAVDKAEKAAMRSRVLSGSSSPPA